MCLSVPMEIREITDNVALVEYEGLKKEVRLDIIDQQPDVGDYIIVHAGFALHRIDEEEAKKTLRYWDEILADNP